MSVRHGCITLMLVAALVAGTGRSARAQAGKCTGRVAVSASRPGAAIYIDGRDSGLVTPATVKGLPCGSHRVEARLELYRSAPRQVVVKRARVVRVKLALEPHFASLQVDSEPAGAMVLLDGKQVGRTPWRLERAAAGEHRLRLELPDYAPFEKRLRVVAGKPARVKARLKPQFGKLVVALPGGLSGRVWLDGVDVGYTPLTLQRVVAGSHLVKVESAGLPPTVQRVQVKAGRLARVVPNMKRRLSTLLVRAGPPPVKVLVDGREQGPAPVQLLLPAGEHLVRVEGGPGTKALERRVKLRAGQTRRLRLRLRPATGSLLIATKPSGARVEVDGKARGRAPVSLAKLPTGVHAIVAKLKGREPLAGRVEVLPGRTARVEMNLEHPARSVFSSGAGPEETLAAGATSAPMVPAAPPEPKPAAADKHSAAPVEPSAGSRPAAKSPAAESLVGERRMEAAPASELETPAAAVAGVEARAEPLSTWRLLAWVSTGTAAATAVTMAVLFGVGAKKRSDADAAWARALDRTLPQPQRDAAYREATDLDEQADGLFLGAWITVGLTAALGGTALYLFLAEPEAGEPRTALHFSPLPAGGWVGWSFTF